MTTLAAGEPDLGPWRAITLADVTARLRSELGRPEGRPPVLAVDGRGSGGKTTLARRLQDAPPAAATLHTDDLAWWHSPFGWDGLLRAVLEPVHRGEPVALRPPAWEEHNRPGAVEVPGGRRS